MRTKCLVAVMSLLLVFGLSAPVLADWVEDTVPGENVQIAEFNMKKVMLETYPTNTNDVDEYMNICVQMEEGSKLPGMLLVDIDVDGDHATGGSGMFYFMQTCAQNPAGPLRAGYPGVDISIAIALANQDSPCPTDWCDGCIGVGAQCFYRTTKCDDMCGSSPNCYTGDSCNPGDDNCFKAGDFCDEPTPTCDNCFVMTEECVIDPEMSCAYPKKRGEWWVTPLDYDCRTMNEPFYSRGRIKGPLPPLGGHAEDAEDKLCIKLPYKNIVDTVIEEHNCWMIGAGKNDSTNIRYVVSAWEDSRLGGCDYINQSVYPPGIDCLHVVEAIPNEGAAPGQTNDGGDCYAYESKFECCLQVKADQWHPDYGDCRGYDTEGDCETNGCFWNTTALGGPACVSKICHADNDGDGFITGGDLFIQKYEQGRFDCPCKTVYP